jgi:hypothetical protein
MTVPIRSQAPRATRPARSAAVASRVVPAVGVTLPRGWFLAARVVAGVSPMGDFRNPTRGKEHGARQGRRPVGAGLGRLVGMGKALLEDPI